jgi:hypothetical protein
MHSVHLGALWRGQLTSDSPTGKSYYEVLDVLIKASDRVVDNDITILAKSHLSVCVLHKHLRS